MRSLDTFVYIIYFLFLQTSIHLHFELMEFESNIFIESVEPVHKAKMIRSQM